ncbi:MAG: hypothetical protein ACFFD4_08545 [Candidatus Odinarchaeota archaeon]
MSKLDIIFSVFDNELGPIPIFSTKKGDYNFGLKIAFKSQLTLSMIDIDKFESTEAVLPFPDIKKIAYVYLFVIKTPFSPRTESIASLSYVINVDDQLDLYKRIPILRKQVTSIASTIMEEYTYRKKEALSEKMINLITSYGSDLTSGIDTMESELTAKKIRMRESKEGNLDYLLKKINKGLDTAMHALLVENPVVVVGDDPIRVSIVVGSLELLVPFKIVRKIDFTVSYINPKEADIIGTDESLGKVYSKKGLVCVKVDKGKVEGGKKSKYLNNFLKELKKLNEEEAKNLIEKEISTILSKAHELTEICNVSQPSEEEIKNFRKQLASDELELILAIATNYNPLIAEHMKREVTEAYAEWLGEV